MPPLPIISGDEFVRAMTQLDWAWGTEDSHMILLSPARRRLSVPRHWELDRGTLRGLIRQAGLPVDEFIALIH